MGEDIKNSIVNRIAFIGNYLPRQCGIATFTTDLCEAIANQFAETTCIALPVNDVESGYAYPTRVRFEIIEKDINTYLSASDFLNINNVDLVCLQFEYGIFGGKAGSYILALLKGLHMPIVTTLHTILKNPNNEQRQVLEEVAALSDRLVVMSESGSEILNDVYGVSLQKIDFIPHGIPDVSFVDPSFNKDLFGVEGKIVLLSFGLLSANKGFETVISALPEIISSYPDIVYIVLGATHPHLLKLEGETYRLSLQLLAKQIGVESNVKFYNRFVSLEELIEFIGAADIYITPYLNEAQITSGTLAYTLGAGKAIISTPYWYAQELLAEGRGALFPFGDHKALAKQVVNLLLNEAERHSMRKRAYMFGRSMIWSEVAKKYMASFDRARVERRNFIRPGYSVKSNNKFPGELPPLKLNHLYRMTDDTGIFQHGFFTVPNYAHGYTTDDNARALLVSILLSDRGKSDSVVLTSKYLAFLRYSFNDKNMRFRNFMDYQRNWLEDTGSDDSHGRALYALGTVLSHAEETKYNSLAAWLFEQALPSILNTTSPRAWSYALLGIYEYLQKYSGDRRIVLIRDELAERIMNLYQSNHSKEWLWYEKTLTYSNAVIPHALLTCGKSIPNKSMLESGLESLNWLAHIQCSDQGHFVPIGSNGFYKKDGNRARFDQQPVEAQVMVSACLAAFSISGDKSWNIEARRAFEWFLGRNDLNLSVYDPITGGCRDGLHSDSLNENQGAESTLAYLQALLELRLAEQTQLTLEAI